MARRASALLALVAASAPGIVYAVTPIEQAKALTDRATVEYQVGRFDQALALYSKAYELVQKPALLFDIGQCHRMLKEYERAILFFQGYLRDKPEATNRRLVEDLIQEATRNLNERRRADAEKAEEERRAAGQTPSEVTSPLPTPVTVPSSVVETPPPPPPPRTGLRIAGVAAAGAGVVLLGTATYFGLHAAALSHDISQLSSEHGTWSSSYTSDYQSGKNASTVAPILFVAGGVALAAGAVLTYLGWPRKPLDSHPVAAIAPLPGGASFGFASSF